jgi:3-oxoacyl-[acyl-carrier-protein] synthase-3
MSFQIIGTGMICAGNASSPNDDLSQLVDTNDEWISQRVGVRSRHICTSETTADLAAPRQDAPLDDCGMNAGDIDLILAASVSADYRQRRPLACVIQRGLGVNCLAF